MKPLVTIGILTKAVEPCVYNAINSAIKQDYDNCEILIINDSGNKDSEEIKDLMNEFNWNSSIRFIHNKKNLGIGATRNVIIDNAKGEYIMFLSDDDELLHECISEMVRFSNKHPESFIYCNYWVIDAEGRTLRDYKVNPEFWKNEEEFKKYVLYYAHQNSIFVCYNMFGPIKLWKENSFDPKLKYLEDYEHLLRCIFIDDVKFDHLPKTLFKYTMRKGSTTSKKWKDLPKDDLKIRLEINKKLGKNILRDEIWAN